MTIFIRSSFLSTLILSSFFVLTSGCGTLIGNRKPVEEKSESYDVTNLSKESHDWEKLDQEKSSTPSTASSDIAYQSKRTSSIISLISACRPIREFFGKSTQEDLRFLTDPLFMGASEVNSRKEQNLIIQGRPALQTIFSGRIENKEIMIQAVVLRSQTCTYEMLYSSRPQTFGNDEKTFTHFVSSFRIHESKQFP